MLIEQAAEMGKGVIVNAKGQITDMQGLNDALFALMEERFQGGMALQSQTFKGLVSNARDAMGTLARELSRPVFDRLKEGLQAAVPVMSAAISVVKGDWQSARETLYGAFGDETALKIENFFLSIQKFFHELQPTVENFKRIMSGLAPILQMVGGAIAVAWRVVTEVLPPVLNFLTEIGARIVEWQGFIPIISGLVAAFVTYRALLIGVNTAQKIYNVTMTVTNTLQRMVRAGQLAMAISGGGLRGVILAISAAMRVLNLTFLANPFVWIPALIVGVAVALWQLYERSETFRNAVNLLWEGIKAGFQWLYTWATTTLPAWWQSVVTGFQNMVNSIVLWFSQLGAKILAILQPFVTYFVQTWENLKLLVLGIIQVFISLITGDFEGLKLGLLAIWTAIKDQALAYWTLLKDTVFKIASALWLALTTSFSNGKTAVVNFVKTTAENIITGFRNAKDSAVQSASNLYNGIVNWIKNIPSKFTEMKNNVIREVKSINLYDIGRDVIQGLLNGLGSMLQSVKNKAREISNTVENAIKDRLKISSPSKVMIDIGKDTGSGFIVGLDETMRSATDKARQLGQNVAEAVANTRQKYDAGLFQFQENNALAKYLNAIIQDGDWMNDWLTHLPTNIRGQVMEFGKQFAQFEGLKSSVFGGGEQTTGETHVHYWQINADEITDVTRLIDIVNGMVQSVRSR